jgi:malto-oligosyltrehalose trehalohydrolase
MPFGAELLPDGTTRFALWAPAQQAVSVVLGEAAGEGLPMLALGDGWYQLLTADAPAGSLYRFRLGDGSLVADPASRHQSQDARGPSEVIDPAAYSWADGDWRGRAWEEAVFYEAHVGAMTPEGSFRAMIPKLEHLRALGVTALEIMPVSDFPGRWNWGYDGVLPFAPDSSYGRPEDLKALIDAAHAKGLMVFLDVVYNHFGPQDNYLHLTAPQIFTDRHQTPWGAAINYDGEGSATVRDFVIHNALYWIEEYHFDGLRLDAVHAIIDDGPRPLLEELAERVAALIGEQRQVHLVLENDANQARFIERHPDGTPRWYCAQWNDDLHHCLHTAATGESGGYYGDYVGDIGKLGRALAEGFAYQGEPSPFRDGQPRGERSRQLPATAFVGFLQNHDQIGNRAFGERLTSLVPLEVARAVASIVLLCPSPPLLFMGEEWGALQPFPYFCDFSPELAVLVRQGRRDEFARFPEFSDPSLRKAIPDPGLETTFRVAKLNWNDLRSPPHAAWLNWYGRVLALRRAEIVPRLALLRGGSATYHVLAPRALTVLWTLGDGSTLSMVANLSAEEITGVPAAPGRCLWCQGHADGERLAAWSVVWNLLDKRGGG